MSKGNFHPELKPKGKTNKEQTTELDQIALDLEAKKSVFADPDQPEVLQLTEDAETIMSNLNVDRSEPTEVLPNPEKPVTPAVVKVAPAPQESAVVAPVEAASTIAPTTATAAKEVTKPERLPPTKALQGCKGVQVLMSDKNEDILWCETCWVCLMIDPKVRTVKEAWVQHEQSNQHTKRAAFREHYKISVHDFVDIEASVNVPSDKNTSSNMHFTPSQRGGQAFAGIVGLDFIVERHNEKDRSKELVCELCCITLACAELSLRAHVAQETHIIQYMHTRHRATLKFWGSRKLIPNQRRARMSEILAKEVKERGSNFLKGHIRVFDPMVARWLRVNSAKELTRRSTKSRVDTCWSVDRKLRTSVFIKMLESAREKIPVNEELSVQRALDRCFQPLIGLREVCQVRCSSMNVWQSFMCCLCPSWESEDSLIEHLTSDTHRQAYLERHYEMYAKMLATGFQSAAARSAALLEYTNEVARKETNLAHRITERLVYRIDPFDLYKVWPGIDQDARQPVSIPTEVSRPSRLTSAPKVYGPPPGLASLTRAAAPVPQQQQQQPMMYQAPGSMAMGMARQPPPMYQPAPQQVQNTRPRYDTSLPPPMSATNDRQLQNNQPFAMPQQQQQMTAAPPLDLAAALAEQRQQMAAVALAAQQARAEQMERERLAQERAERANRSPELMDIADSPPPGAPQGVPSALRRAAPAQAPVAKQTTPANSAVTDQLLQALEAVTHKNGQDSGSQQSSQSAQVLRALLAERERAKQQQQEETRKQLLMTVAEMVEQGNAIPQDVLTALVQAVAPQKDTVTSTAQAPATSTPQASAAPTGDNTSAITQALLALVNKTQATRAPAAQAQPQAQAQTQPATNSSTLSKLSTEQLMQMAGESSAASRTVQMQQQQQQLQQQQQQQYYQQQQQVSAASYGRPFPGMPMQAQPQAMQPQQPFGRQYPNMPNMPYNTGPGPAPAYQPSNMMRAGMMAHGPGSAGPMLPPMGPTGAPPRFWNGRPY